MNWVRQHFRRHRKRTPGDFCWRITIEGMVVGLAASYTIQALGIPPRKIDIAFWPLLLMGVVIAPIFETLLLQAFPVWIARLCKARFSTQVLSTVVPFALLHAIEGVQAGVAAGLFGGFYFAFTYVHWREKGRWPAFWVTAVSHAIHNAILIPLALVSGEIAV